MPGKWFRRWGAVGAMATLLLGCARGPGAGAPQRRPGEVATPPPVADVLPRGEDPSQSITRVAASVPNAGMVAAVHLGNVALVAIRLDSRETGGTQPPGAGLRGDPTPAPLNRPGASTAGPYGTSTGQPTPGSPGVIDRPDQGPTAPDGVVEGEVAARVQSAFPYVVELRFARDDDEKRELVGVVNRVRAGEPVANLLPELVRLAPRLHRVSVPPGARVPASHPAPAPAPVPAGPGGAR